MYCGVFFFASHGIYKTVGLAVYILVDRGSERYYIDARIVALGMLASAPAPVHAGRWAVRLCIQRAYVVARVLFSAAAAALSIQAEAPHAVPHATQLGVALTVFAAGTVPCPRLIGNARSESATNSRSECLRDSVDRKRHEFDMRIFEFHSLLLKACNEVITIMFECVA